MSSVVCEDARVLCNVLAEGCADESELNLESMHYPDQGEMTRAKVQSIYDELRDRYEKGDEMDRSDVNYRAVRYLPLFFRFGINLRGVAEMLTHEDLVAHYDEFREHGATFKVCDFIEGDLVVNYEDACNLLNDGMSPKLVLELSKEWFFLHDELAEGNSAKLLMALYDKGLSTEEIRQFIEVNMSEGVLYDMFIRSPEDWEYMDIHVSDYNQEFLRKFGREYFNLQSVKELPRCISMEEFVNFYSMDDILRYTKEKGFFGFLLDIAEEGADIDQVLNKFMFEIGYSNNSVYTDALFDLLLMVTPGAIEEAAVDIDDFVKTIDTKELDKGEKLFYYYYLKELGAHSGYLCKFCV